MKRFYLWGLAAIAACGMLGALSVRWLSPSPKGPGNPPPPPEAPPGAGPQRTLTLEQIADQLALQATRPQALAQLQRVPYQRIERLREIENDLTDAQVKADLERQVVALEQQVAVDPPPISLHVKDASLEDIIAAINEQMGTHVGPRPIAAQLVPPGAFTVDLDQKPFWEVVSALADQHAVSFNGVFDHMFLAEDMRGMPSRAISGPCCVYASMRDNQPLPGARAPATTRPLKWTLRYTLGVDPRLWALLGAMKLTLSPDDAGNVLESSDTSYVPHPQDLRGNSYYAEADFTPPAHPGKMIPWIKIEGTLRVVTSDQQMVVDYSESADRDFQLGDTAFNAKCFQRPQIPRTDFSIAVHAADGKPIEARMRLLDQTDVRISPPPQGVPNATYQFNFPGVPAPLFKLEVRVPKTIEERTVSFEIKNVPLPELPH